MDQNSSPRNSAKYIVWIFVILLIITSLFCAGFTLKASSEAGKSILFENFSTNLISVLIIICPLLPIIPLAGILYYGTKPVNAKKLGTIMIIAVFAPLIGVMLPPFSGEEHFGLGIMTLFYLLWNQMAFAVLVYGISELSFSSIFFTLKKHLPAQKFYQTYLETLLIFALIMGILSMFGMTVFTIGLLVSLPILIITDVILSVTRQSLKYNSGQSKN